MKCFIDQQVDYVYHVSVVLFMPISWLKITSVEGIANLI